MVGAGVASAAAPNAPTTINGCVGLTGLLRVLEPPATTCGLLEKPLQVSHPCDSAQRSGWLVDVRNGLGGDRTFFVVAICATVS